MSKPGRRMALENSIPLKKRPATKVPIPRPGSLCACRDIVKLRLEFFALTCALENFRHRVAPGKKSAIRSPANSRVIRPHSPH